MLLNVCAHFHDCSLFLILDLLNFLISQVECLYNEHDLVVYRCLLELEHAFRAENPGFIKEQDGVDKQPLSTIAA